VVGLLVATIMALTLLLVGRGSAGSQAAGRRRTPGKPADPRKPRAAASMEPGMKKAASRLSGLKRRVSVPRRNS
jgi:hypothetical protein